MSCPLATFAVSFSPRKGDFVGREALARQHAAYGASSARDYSLLADLPRLTRPLAVTGRGIAREGAPVSRPGGGDVLGWVTSGTAVPFWGVEGEGLCSTQTESTSCAPSLWPTSTAACSKTTRSRSTSAAGASPAWSCPTTCAATRRRCARAIVWDHAPQLAELEGGESRREGPAPARRRRSTTTSGGRSSCIDLIPSEMTASPMVRLLSIMDPAFRYAEHKKTEAFYDVEVFYYQGTGFIHEVERLLAGELRAYLGCPEVETRVISGQMANTAVFSALVDYLNRADRKAEPRRIGKVINNHIGKGGHLSAQPMGALRDYVARDPRTELPAVADIPVLADNPYKADVPALLDLIEKERPELIILGKSMVLHPEPVHEVRTFLDAELASTPCSCTTWRTSSASSGRTSSSPSTRAPTSSPAPRTRRSSAPSAASSAGAGRSPSEKWELWEAIERRAFPGSVSNHHLGTPARPAHGGLRDEPLQGRLPAGRDRQRQGLRRGPARRPASTSPATRRVDYTETHQVIVRVGYGRGAEVAGRLEDNNIICNYQAAPDEEGFTAAGALRLGVAEMTRFGMAPDDFAEVARAHGGGRR